MGLADLIVDGASASLLNKLTDVIEGYNDETLEYKEHQTMLGDLDTRVVDAAKQYLKIYGDEIIQSAKDATIKLGRDAASASKEWAQINITTNVEDRINATLGDFYQKISGDSSALANESATQDFINSRGPMDLKAAQLNVPQRENLRGTSASGYAKLQDFLQSLTSSNPLYRLMHKYFFIVTIEFPDIHKIQSSNTQFMKEYRAFSTNYKTIQILARRAEIPHIRNEVITLKNDFGYISLPGKTTMASDNGLIISFLSTEYSIHESLILEWMREATSNEYIYSDFPFMKANIKIQFFDQGFQKVVGDYSFNDCFPQNISTLDPNYDDVSVGGRDVRFVFDWMNVDNKYSPTYVKSSRQIDDINVFGGGIALY